MSVQGQNRSSELTQCSCSVRVGVYVIAMAIEELTYAVEHWSDDGNKLIEVLARASNQGVAVAAFKTVRAMKPSNRIMLRQRARTILDSVDKPIS